VYLRLGNLLVPPKKLDQASLYSMMATRRSGLEVALAKALQVGSSLPVHFTVGTNGQGRCLSDRDGWYWNSGRREAEAMELRKVVLAGLAGAVSVLFIMVTAKGRMRQTQDPGSVSDSDLRTVRIRLERSTCFGSCASYSLVIHGD